jgi:hypothetical protein
VDLLLAEAAGLHRARGRGEVAGPGVARRPQPGPDVDGGDAGRGDRARGQHDVQVAVAVGVDALDVQDAARGLGARRAVAGHDTRSGGPSGTGAAGIPNAASAASSFTARGAGAPRAARRC